MPLEDFASLELSILSRSYNLSVPSSTGCSEHWENDGDPGRLVFQSVSVSPHCQVVNVYIYSHLLKEENPLMAG